LYGWTARPKDARHQTLLGKGFCALAIKPPVEGTKEVRKTLSPEEPFFKRSILMGLDYTYMLYFTFPKSCNFMAKVQKSVEIFLFTDIF
jgi:hypothetical protein